MAEVKFKRIESSSEISGIPVLDGQMIYTKDGNQYMDYGNQRVQFSSGSGGGSQGVVLWQNPQGATQSFSPQTVNLSDNIDNYYEYEVIFGASMASSGYYPVMLRTGRIQKNNPTKIFNVSISEDSPFTVRIINQPSGTTIEFNSAYYMRSSGTYATDNSYLIPLYVIGYTDKSYNY